MIIGTNKNVRKTADFITVRVDGAFLRKVNEVRYLGFMVYNQFFLEKNMSQIFPQKTYEKTLKRVRECMIKETFLEQNFNRALL